MTELPPNAGATSDDDDDFVDPLHDELVQVGDDYGAPDVQALVALVLGVASILGFGLLNGTTYVFLTIGPGDSIKTANVLAACARRCPRARAGRPRLAGERSRPRQRSALGRDRGPAAVLLGLLSVVLRLVVAVPGRRRTAVR